MAAREAAGKTDRQVKNCTTDNTSESTVRNLSAAEIAALYQEGNDSGNGYSIGRDDDTAEQALEASASHRYLDTVGEYAIGVEDGGRYVIVGYAHGPWAVTIVTLDVLDDE